MKIAIFKQAQCVDVDVCCFIAVAGSGASVSIGNVPVSI